MELKHYWRVLQRRRRIAIMTFVIVALASLALIAYSTYGSVNITQMSVIVVQQAPTTSQLAKEVKNLNSVPWDESKETLSLSVDAVNNVFSATDTRNFFDDLSAMLKKNYGINKRWDALQAGLSIYPAARNVMFFKMTGSPVDNDTNAKIVQTAAQWVENYVNTRLPALYRATNPPRAAVYDPVNVRQEHIISKHVGELAFRLLGGLVLGLVLAFVWEYLDEYVHDEHDVENLLGTATLVVIPASNVGKRAG